MVLAEAVFHFTRFLTEHGLAYGAFTSAHALALLEHLRRLPSRRASQRLGLALCTTEYAPRLRRRRQVELTLIKDAGAQGWIREVERHRCTVQRIDQLLAELNEPADGPVDE